MNRSDKTRQSLQSLLKSRERRRVAQPVHAAIVVFAKAPIPGHVKTRLCPPLTPDEAASLHGSMVLDTLERSRTIRGTDRFLACAPSKQHPFFKAVGARQGVTLWDQTGEDLGTRMNQAFHSAFTLGYETVLLVGSDLPTIEAETFHQALQALEKHDLVLGPTVDGGYYLIGLHKPVAALFADVPWSTDQVLPLTQQKAQGGGLSLHLLSQQRDLDTVNDLQVYMNQSQGKGPKGLSTRTAQVLKTLSKCLMTRDEHHLTFWPSGS